MSFSQAAVQAYLDVTKKNLHFSSGLFNLFQDYKKEIYKKSRN